MRTAGSMVRPSVDCPANASDTAVATPDLWTSDRGRRTVWTTIGRER